MLDETYNVQFLKHYRIKINFRSSLWCKSEPSAELNLNKHQQDLLVTNFAGMSVNCENRT